MGDEMMSEKRGGSISEEDLSAVAQRYKTTTVLNLLQEVGQVQDVMIDWYAMVKHTKTGITNPREYQMLWRHLAYREPLIEEFEDDFKPLVLIASDSSSESCIEKGLVMEAPLMINIPKDKSTPPPSSDESTQLASSTGGVNITVPVFVPTQVVPPVLSGETLDTTNTCQNSNFPSRRKRKPWSAQEDRSLFDAVQICGEGNWANISKGDFKGERTASQLSQRWSIIKKRHTNSNMKTGPQLSEVQLAARHALNMALDKPGGATFSNKPVQPTMAEPPSAATLRQNQSQADPKRLFPRPLASGPDAVKAAAVAAGARIATQSAAAVILKAQLKSAIHINKMGNGTSRPPVARMGGPRERYSSISPHGPRPNLGSGHGNSNVGRTTGPHGGLQVKPSGPPSPVESVKEEQVVVSESLQKMNLESDLKDQEEKVVPTCLS
ncbi:uncharacterized protein LOC111898827 isoform X2 [Lactuca sativa]|uniref:uncharacterized protein LOC111898827 isoform X2 n=1 Tax=Lactuca sativa TaxID=4236 RepID=UPI000CD826FD|nr:uncharacterized protein LOC111898827 isoform X2 [Lactuca sativa]